MVQGFKNSPMILEKLMKKIFYDSIRKGFVSYFDDLIIYAKSEKEHDEILKVVLDRCLANNFIPNIKKMQFKQQEIKNFRRKHQRSRDNTIKRN
ncbi:hypothetical protein COBT_002343 [Conglomerata obtusa]